MVHGRGTSSDTFLDAGTYIHRLSMRVYVSAYSKYSSVCRYWHYRSRTGLPERITDEESKHRSIEATMSILPYVINQPDTAKR